MADAFIFWIVQPIASLVGNVLLIIAFLVCFVITALLYEVFMYLIQKRKNEQ